MLKLTRENFAKARAYIFANSDDIGRAWFRYHFEGNDTSVFMDALAKYQYENGGFGGLCYEFDYQGSCLKSTENAIWYIIGLKHKPPASHPVIQKLMKYLLKLYLPSYGNWGDILVPEINEGVHLRHVTWGRYLPSGWTPPTQSEDERIANYQANERAVFAAFVALYSETVPEELYLDIIKYPSECILRHYDANSPDLYDLLYYKDFVYCLKDKTLAGKLVAVLSQNPTACMELDFSKADNNYVHLPCDFVDSPDSFLYTTLKKLVDDSLTCHINRQRNDGGWNIGWSFGKDDKFRKIEKLYEAYLSLGILVKLGRFGRMYSPNKSGQETKKSYRKKY